MATMFGRFDIQTEISKSDTALIYKATDTETNQVVALKTQSLQPLGDRAQAFVETLIAEGERTRELVSQNIVPLYGAGEIDGQFCAAMEYIQGNSIATMLSRKEGFSIWDLLDITRQVCAAVGHAGTLGVVHSSLEPAKIMVQWDGLVKILGYGISNMSLIEAEAGNGLGRLMPYCSPEQIRGEAIDQRSNLFTIGAILYEMVTTRKAFDATDPVALVGQIENDTPVEPVALNPKIQPGVSALIMKALAKDPAARYQNARELVEDLEKCKENGKKAAEPKRATAAGAVKVDPAARAAAAAKFVSSVATASEHKPAATARSASAKPATDSPSAHPVSQPPAQHERAATGAAMSVGHSGAAAAPAYDTLTPSAASESSGSQLIEEVDESPEFEPSYSADPVLSAATAEEEPGAPAPKVAVDPMMAGGAATSSGRSFSDLDELPPLKEPVFTPPPAPEPEEAPRANVQQVYPKLNSKIEDKPKIQPKEVAEKAIKEISTIPPRLMLFSILGAVAVILVIAVALFFHVRSEDDGATAAPRSIKAEATPQAAPAPAPAAAAPTPVPAPPIAEAEPPVTVRKVEPRRNPRAKAQAPPPAPAIIPGMVLVDSTPQGVGFQVDGKTDPSWITPFTVSGMMPGKHIVSIAKNGYGSEMRSLDVVSGGKSSVVIHLAAVNALVVVSSTPAGAEITLDGKVTGRVTPAQFAVEKGSHTVSLKKQGYLDETATSDLGPGQNFQFAPTLKALGNADDIRTVGKFKKLFGGSNDSTAGMGGVSIHTLPKGAQVAINQRMLDKLSPVEIMMGPGNYVVDITMTGFKSVHKVITVEKGGKVAIDETLERE